MQQNSAAYQLQDEYSQCCPKNTMQQTRIKKKKKSIKEGASI